MRNWVIVIARRAIRSVSKNSLEKPTRHLSCRLWDALDNRGDKFHRDTLYTSHVCMKPAAYRLENNQSTPRAYRTASWTHSRDFAYRKPDDSPGDRLHGSLTLSPYLFSAAFVFQARRATERILVFHIILRLIPLENLKTYIHLYVFSTGLNIIV